METNIAVFKGKEIRKTIHKNEWWFVVEDVVLALIDSSDPKQYIQRMKQRDPELGKGVGGTICTPLEIAAPDVKTRETNCANTGTVLRIIQSIPRTCVPRTRGDETTKECLYCWKSMCAAPRVREMVLG